MKKIIYFYGIVCLVMVIILNIMFTANMDRGEHITIKFNSYIYIIGLLVFGI